MSQDKAELCESHEDQQENGLDSEQIEKVNEESAQIHHRNSGLTIERKISHSPTISEELRQEEEELKLSESEGNASPEPIDAKWTDEQIDEPQDLSAPYPSSQQKQPSNKEVTRLQACVGLDLFWEQKKRNFNNLKMWEDERYFQFTRQRALLGNIYQRLLTKATIGKDTNLTLAKFLKEASQADVIYANSMKNELIFLPHTGSRTNHHALKHGLAAVCEFQNELATKLKHSTNFVERNLLKQEFSSMVLKYESTVQHRIAEITQLSADIDACQAVTMRLYKEHLVDFHKMEVATTQGEPFDRCLWLSEHYTEALLQFWDVLVELEEMRLTVTRSVMLGFMGQRMEMYKRLQIASIALDSISETSIDPSPQLDPERIVTPDEASLLISETGREDLREAMASWPYPQPPPSSLISKDGNLWKETDTEAKRFKRCYVVITVDSYMHIFNGPEDISDIVISFNLRGAMVREMV